MTNKPIIINDKAKYYCTAEEVQQIVLAAKESTGLSLAHLSRTIGAKYDQVKVWSKGKTQPFRKSGPAIEMLKKIANGQFIIQEI